MAFLHYGSELRIELDESEMRQAMEAIASHATRGGWVIVTDVNGKEWSILLTSGIPVWVNTDA
jgi:hypothetical protein